MLLVTVTMQIDFWPTLFARYEIGKVRLSWLWRMTL